MRYSLSVIVDVDVAALGSASGRRGDPLPADVADWEVGDFLVALATGVAVVDELVSIDALPS